MTIPQFAKAIGVGRSTAYRMVVLGQVETVNVGCASTVRLRITPAHYEAYLESRKVRQLASAGAR
jgi:hypothetical protein